MTAPAAVGDTILHVASNDGFYPGTYAVVGSGDGMSETVVVDSLGSLHLRAPLVNAYSAGVLVKAFANNEAPQLPSSGNAFVAELEEKLTETNAQLITVTKDASEANLALKQAHSQVNELKGKLEASQAVVIALQAEKPADDALDVKFEESMREAEMARLNAELEASQAMVIALQAEAQKPAHDALDINEAVSQEESDHFFDLYDTDGSGTVDMEELLEMVAAFKQRDSSSLNQAKIKEVWDADGDGMVSLLAAM